MSSLADVLLVESNSSRQGGAVRSILMLSEHPGGGETGSPMWMTAEPPCSCLLFQPRTELALLTSLASLSLSRPDQALEDG